MLPTNAKPLALALALAFSHAAHAADKILWATGDAGGLAAGLGISSLNPGVESSESDGTRFAGFGAFGGTDDYGSIDTNTAIPMSLDVASSDQLPQVTDQGEVNVIWRQFNEDGPEPTNCRIDTDGNGQDWAPCNLRAQMNRGRKLKRQGDEAGDNLSLVAEIPSGLNCQGQTDSIQNFCIIQLTDENDDDLVGGNVAFQIASNQQKKRTAKSGNGDHIILPKSEEGTQVGKAAGVRSFLGLL